VAVRAEPIGGEASQTRRRRRHTYADSARSELRAVHGTNDDLEESAVAEGTDRGTPLRERME
jgi:hypothetical protein